MFQPPASLNLTEERTFTARLGNRTATGLAVADAWRGFTMYSNPAGAHLIVLDAEQRVVSGSPELMAQLGLVVDPLWVTVPATTLPGGVVVPSFQVARHLSARDAAGYLSFDPAEQPWANISFDEAKAAAILQGYKLITETQWLAIAWNLSQVASNWTGGAVGEGAMFQGIRNGGGARPGVYEPTSSDEQRWLTLSNGERLCDFNGNLFSWVFDDVQGASIGTIGKTIGAESLSRAVARAAGGAEWRKKGLGWQPSGEAPWSGFALVRGGFFCSGDNAGVFDLDRVSPGYRSDYVGFRCTK